MTATLVLTGEQIVSLFEQLDPRSKRAVLYELSESVAARRMTRMATAEAGLRRRASERGIDWETLSEAEREAFVDDLVHEDR